MPGKTFRFTGLTKGVYSAANPFDQPQGSLPRVHNMVLTERGSLMTIDGTHIVSGPLGFTPPFPPTPTGNNLFLMAGVPLSSGSAFIRRSTDLLTWTSVNIPGALASNFDNYVDIHGDGTNFVSVGSGIAYSIDKGVSFTAGPNDPNNFFMGQAAQDNCSAAISDVNGRWVVGGEDDLATGNIGTIWFADPPYTSWTQVRVGGNTPVLAVAFGSGKGFVATTGSGIFHSVLGGNSWTQVAAFGGLIALYNGSSFLCPNGATNQTSPDGVTWTSNVAPQNMVNGSNRVQYFTWDSTNSQWIAVTSQATGGITTGRIYTSPGGGTWTLRFTGATTSIDTMYRLAKLGSTWYASGWNSVAVNPVLYTSTDTITWTRHQLAIPSDSSQWYGCLASATELGINANTNQGSGVQVFKHSTDGTTFSDSTLTVSDGWLESSMGAWVST